MVQVVHHLGQKLLGFILSCHILEGHRIVVFLIFPGIGLAEAAHTEAAEAAHGARHPLGKPVAECPEQKDRNDPAEDEGKQRAGLHRDLLVEADALILQLVDDLRLRVFILQASCLAGDLAAVHFHRIDDGIVAEIHTGNGVVVHRIDELIVGGGLHASREERREDEGIQHQNDDERHQIIEHQGLSVLRRVLISAVSVLISVQIVEEIVKVIVSVSSALICHNMSFLLRRPPAAMRKEGQHRPVCTGFSMNYDLSYRGFVLKA